MVATDGLAVEHGQMDDQEAGFHRVVHYAAGLLWSLGAVEDTLASLYDLLQETIGDRDLDEALAVRATGATDSPRSAIRMPHLT